MPNCWCVRWGAALLSASVGAALVVVLFHPDRIAVNADDGWPILQSAHYSLRRDGVLMWGVDRIGGLHILAAHAVLERLGLRAVVPHRVYLQFQQALLLLLSMQIVVRETWGKVLAASAMVCLLAAEGTPTYGHLNYWLARIGIAYPAVMFTAFAAFRALHAYIGARTFSAWRGLVWVILAVCACVCSPGNLVMLGVWVVCASVVQARQVSTQWRRMLGAIVALVVGAGMAWWIKGIYDVTYHAHRQVTPMGFAWGQWRVTLERFVQQLRAWGMLYTSIAGAGALLLIIVPLWQAGAGRLRIVPGLSPHARRMLWQAGALACGASVYVALVAANVWVHMNPQNPTYVIPAFLSYCAALLLVCDLALRAVHQRMPMAVALAMAMLAIGLVTRHRPRHASSYYTAARAVLQKSAATGQSFALLGDFWHVCWYSVFDPHRLLSSSWPHQLLGDAMLPYLRNVDRVLVNFAGAENLGWSQAAPPFALDLRGLTLLNTRETIPADYGIWHVYQPITTTVWETLPNLVHGPLQLQANAVITGQVVRITNDGEIFCDLGMLPAGDYLLAITARACGPVTPVTPLVHYVLDTELESPYAHLVVNMQELHSSFREFTRHMYYPGSTHPARMRVYAYLQGTIEIARIGIFPLRFTEPHTP